MPQGLSQFGTPILLSLYQLQGALGTRNVQQEINARWEEISAARLKEGFFVRHSSCYRCPVSRGKISRIRKGPFGPGEWKTPEYETLFALGTMLVICDLSFLIAANQFCDLIGMDNVTMGVTLSCAIECYERGSLSTAETGGMRLRFGDPELAFDLIRMTASKEGMGKLLAEGSLRMAMRLGC